MSTVDLDAIRGKWLRVCGSCDAGLSTVCVCPQEDPRPVMLELVREVERLRAHIAAHAGPHRRLIAERDEARAEVDRLRATVDRVRALHSPEPGWEREWAYPEHALAKGWPRCAGCLIEGVAHREIGDCPTLRALDEPATGEDGTRDG